MQRQLRLRAQEAGARGGRGHAGPGTPALGSAAGGGDARAHHTLRCAEQGGGFRRRVHQRQNGQCCRPLTGPQLAALQSGRGDGRARPTREREDACGARGGAPASREGGVGHRRARCGRAASGCGGRTGARPLPQRRVRRAAPTDDSGGPGLARRRQEPRGRRCRPPCHPGPAPAAPLRRRRCCRGRCRGRPVLLLRDSGWRQRRRHGLQSNCGCSVVQGLRTGGGMRSAAPVPPPVPLRCVRTRCGLVPGLRSHQERFAPCIALLSLDAMQLAVPSANVRRSAKFIAVVLFSNPCFVLLHACFASVAQVSRDQDMQLQMSNLHVDPRLIFYL